MASNSGFILLRAVLIIPLIGLWILVHPEPSYACSCVENGSPIEELANSAAVFMGRVVSVHELDPGDSLWGGARHVSSSDPTTIGFAVQTVWKGPLFQTTYLTTHRSEASCGFTFVEGETYIVYSRDGSTVSLCSRTARLSEAMDDLDALGEGYMPVQGLAAPTPDLSEQRSGGCGLSPNAETDLSIVGMMVGVAWVAFRRRRPDPP